MVKYCNKDCQRAHWIGGHKLLCSEMKAMRVERPVVPRAGAAAAEEKPDGPVAPRAGTAAAEETKPERDRGNCWTCGADNPIHQCNKCKISRYCNVTCQTANWSYHKRRCKELAAQAASFDKAKAELRSLARGEAPSSQASLGGSLISACFLGRLADVQRVIALGAPVDYVDLAFGDVDRTPINVAVGEGHFRIVETLVQHGALVNKPLSSTEASRTPLITAARGHVRVVEVLLRHGVVVNAADENGCTAVALAAQLGELSIVTLLLQHGADVNIANSFSSSALLLAAQMGHRDVVTLLLERGAQVDQPDAMGRTACCAAAAHGHAAIVAMLLQAGARPSDPLLMATRRRFPEVVAVIRAHMAERQQERDQGL